MLVMKQVVSSFAEGVLAPLGKSVFIGIDVK